MCVTALSSFGGLERGSVPWIRLFVRFRPGRSRLVRESTDRTVPSHTIHATYNRPTDTSTLDISIGRGRR